jgi:iron(III) transport system permease protein
MTLNSYVYAFVMILGGAQGGRSQPRGGGDEPRQPMPRVLTGVTLRLIVPSIFGAAVVVFTHVIGSFGIPAILGPRMPVLAVKAYNEFVSELGGNPQMQTVMASLLVILGVATLAVQKLVVERGQYQMESGRTPAPIPIRGAAATFAAALVVIVVVLSLAPGGGRRRHGLHARARARAQLRRIHARPHDDGAHEVGAADCGIRWRLPPWRRSRASSFSVAAAYLVVKRRSPRTADARLLVMLPLTDRRARSSASRSVNTFNTGLAGAHGHRGSSWRSPISCAAFPNSVRAAGRSRCTTCEIPSRRRR